MGVHHLGHGDDDAGNSRVDSIGHLVVHEHPRICYCPVNLKHITGGEGRHVVPRREDITIHTRLPLVDGYLAVAVGDVDVVLLEPDVDDLLRAMRVGELGRELDVVCPSVSEGDLGGLAKSVVGDGNTVGLCCGTQLHGVPCIGHSSGLVGGVVEHTVVTQRTACTNGTLNTLSTLYSLYPLNDETSERVATLPCDGGDVVHALLGTDQVVGPPLLVLYARAQVDLERIGVLARDIDHVVALVPLALEFIPHPGHVCTQNGDNERPYVECDL